jgi:hypothetical protein
MRVPGNVNSCDPWEAYEARKFEKSWFYCIARWNQIVNLARRIKKLEEKRIINNNYCSKSNYNIDKYIRPR